MKRCSKAGCPGGAELVAAGPAPTGDQRPNLLATDEASVYVASSTGVIARAPLGLHGALTTLVPHTRAFTGLALTATDVFFADEDGAVFRCAKPDCVGGPAAVATTLGARSLTSDQTTAFWLSDRGKVWSANASGTVAGPLFEVADGFERSYQPPRAIAADTKSFFFGAPASSVSTAEAAEHSP